MFFLYQYKNTKKYELSKSNAKINININIKKILLVLKIDI